MDHLDFEYSGAVFPYVTHPIRTPLAVSCATWVTGVTMRDSRELAKLCARLSHASARLHSDSDELLRDSKALLLRSKAILEGLHRPAAGKLNHVPL